MKESRSSVEKWMKTEIRQRAAKSNKFRITNVFRTYKTVNDKLHLWHSLIGLQPQIVDVFLQYDRNSFFISFLFFVLENFIRHLVRMCMSNAMLAATHTYIHAKAHIPVHLTGVENEICVLEQRRKKIGRPRIVIKLSCV